MLPIIAGKKVDLLRATGRRCQQRVIGNMPHTHPQRSPDEPNALLARHIIAHYKEAIRLDPPSLDFIQGTISAADAAELNSVLNDRDDSDRDTLLALLFSPDEILQVALEPLFARARYNHGDQAVIAGLLSTSLPQVTIRMPDQQAALAFPVPDWAWEQLVAGLNITWRLPSKISRAIEVHLPPSKQSQVRVNLRNMGFSTSEEGVETCVRLMAAYPHFQNKFMAYLDFWGDFLCQHSDLADIYTALMTNRRHYQRGYHQAQRFEALRAAHNIETLMLQGVTAPAMSVDKSRRMIIMIDDIAGCIFDL